MHKGILFLMFSLSCRLITVERSRHCGKIERLWNAQPSMGHLSHTPSTEEPEIIAGQVDGEILRTRRWGWGGGCCKAISGHDGAVAHRNS